MNKMLSTTEFKTADDIDRILAKRLKDIRKRKKLSQENLAYKSGVSLGSLKRFESTGKISLLSFTKLAKVLGYSDDIEDLFTEPRYESIEEVINERKQETT